MFLLQEYICQKCGLQARVGVEDVFSVEGPRERVGVGYYFCGTCGASGELWRGQQGWDIHWRSPSIARRKTTRAIPFVRVASPSELVCGYCGASGKVTNVFVNEEEYCPICKEKTLATRRR